MDQDSAAEARPGLVSVVYLNWSSNQHVLLASAAQCSDSRLKSGVGIAQSMQHVFKQGEKQSLRVSEGAPS